MAWPTTVPSVATGDTFTETLWNSYVRDQVNGLLSPPVCIVGQAAGTSQQLTASIDTAITMDTSEANPDAMWSATTNPSRITVATAGLYVICGSAVIAQYPGYTGLKLEVWKNGAVTTLRQSFQGDGNAAISLHGTLVLAANDYVQLYANSNGFTAPVTQARFGVVWVSRTS